jgi:hypothetical protein
MLLVADVEGARWFIQQQYRSLLCERTGND